MGSLSGEGTPDRCPFYLPWFLREDESFEVGVGERDCIGHKGSEDLGGSQDGKELVLFFEGSFQRGTDPDLDGRVLYLFVFHRRDYSR
jgi:hypothetical protein